MHLPKAVTTQSSSADSTQNKGAVIGSPKCIISVCGFFKITFHKLLSLFSIHERFTKTHGHATARFISCFHSFRVLFS